MGLFEEPRCVIQNVCNHFYEMPENTIREQTFCCGGGPAWNRRKHGDAASGRTSRANAVKYVHERHGVNRVAASVRSTGHAAALFEYWVPGVGVTGVHELVGNALVMKGEKERTTDLRGEPLEGMDGNEDL